MKHTIESYTEIPLDDVRAGDLRDLIDSYDRHVADGDGEGDVGPLSAARVRLHGAPEAVEVVLCAGSGRAGIAWGAEARWTDADSLEDAVERWISDAMVE